MIKPPHPGETLKEDYRVNISTNTEEMACAVLAGAVPSLRTRRCRSTDRI